MKHLPMLVAATLLWTPFAIAGDNPIEVGDVKWGRDLQNAYATSQATGRPVLVLFQEVPGCAGCQDFGRDVLSHPLMVEAIETLFVPVLVYNNRGGVDQEILKRFGEPAWNYQVVRFLDASGADIVPRKDRIWTVGALASRMQNALAASEQSIPKYLQALATEGRIGDEAAFSMHCFWVGEAAYGKLEGVHATEVGWLDGHEVTRVRYDASQISLAEIVAAGRAASCANRVYVPPTKEVPPKLHGLKTGILDDGYRAAAKSDQKRQLLRNKRLLEVPGITQMQLTKINAFCHADPDAAAQWLSPRQRAWLK